MTHEEAKEILLLYRPGTPDAEEPEIIQAMEVARSDAERELDGQHTDRRGRVIEEPASLGQREQIGTDPEFDPVRRKLPVQGKPERGAVELAHGAHLAGKDHGVVEATNRELRVHRSKESAEECRRRI